MQLKEQSMVVACVLPATMTWPADFRAEYYLCLKAHY